VNRLVPAGGAALALVSAAAVALLVAPPGRPAEPTAPGDDAPRARPVVDSRARVLLDRAAAAPAHTPYHGVQFVSAWTSGGATSEVVDVDHDPARGTTVHSDGTALVPARSVTLLAAGAPSLAGGSAVGLLVRNYSLSVVGSDEVAGRPADVVAARTPGSPTTAPDAARFWFDRESGLVLRREVYDARGRTTRASAFVEVTVGDSAGSSRAADGTGTTSSAWAATVDAATLAAMRRHGWHCPRSLPGRLTLVDARRGGDDQGILHLSYSDGIASVSVFEQRGRLDESGLAGHRRESEGGHHVYVRGQVPRRVVWASGSTVYTVVADAPERTVDSVVAALPHRAPDDGPMGRLGRGLDRVASWFNPFG
jgi:sigma-E factor negative regulatory protein RseB